MINVTEIGIHHIFVSAHIPLQLRGGFVVFVCIVAEVVPILKKAGQDGGVYMGAARCWTPKEIEYLKENWGNKSVDKISKRLGRSSNAICIKIQRLGLGSFFDNNYKYITKNQLLKSLGSNSGYGYINISWVKNRGLKTHKVKIKNGTYDMIDIEEFWEFAYENMNFLDFSKFEKYALGPEPDWVEQKRQRDIRKKIHFVKTPWTRQEDERLEFLLSKKKYNYRELSLKLSRTEGAIQRRICDLKLEIRPIKADNHTKWTEDEYFTLGELIKQGCNYEEMSEILGKSAKAIRGRVYNSYLTESLDKVRQIISNGQFGDNLPPKQLKHKNLLSKEERDDVKELLSDLIACLMYKSNSLKAYDEFFQKDVCVHWDKYKGCMAGEYNCDECCSFQRIKPQFCKRCGKDFIERKEQLYCKECRDARRKQGYKKYLRMRGGFK